MNNKIMQVARKRGEKGQVLVITLVLLLIGSIIIPALLSNMASGVKTNRVFENKTSLLYSADAGIEDGKWHVKHDHLAMISGYDAYDYSTLFHYDLLETANDQNVTVYIQNVWVPDTAINRSGYSETQLKKIVEIGNTSGDDSGVTGLLVVKGNATGDITTSVPSTANYQIKINYTPGTDEVGTPLNVKTIGVWIPTGFSYVVGSCTLETDSGNTYHLNDATPAVSPGGSSVIWTYSTAYPFAGDTVHTPNKDPLPGVTPSETSTMSCIVSFKVTRDSTTATSQEFDSVSWITTDCSISSLPFAWDNDTKFYYIKSISGTTSVETYIAKNELRKMQSAVAGDYYATGQSVMQDTNSSPQYRERLLTSSTSDIAVIPSDAEVDAAYLYWSGWVQNYGSGIFWDQCDYNYLTDKWASGGTWVADNSGSGSGYTDKYKGTLSGSSLTMKNAIDLSGVTTSATIKWDQTVSGTASSNVNQAPIADADSSGTWTVNPNYVAAGSVSYGTGNINPGLPAVWAQNDIFLLFVETANETVAAPSGWTAVANSPQGTGTAGGNTATRLSVFWRRATASEFAPTVSDPGDHAVGQILAFRGCATSGNPWDTTSGDVASSAGTGASIPGATTTVNSCLIVAAVTNGTDTGTVQTSAWTNSNLVNLTEIVDSNTSSGNGGGFGIAAGIKALAGSYGYTTATLATSSVQGRISIALKPGLSSEYAAVDETSPNDNDFIVGSGSGSDSYYLFTANSFSIPSGAAVTSLAIYYRAADASSGTNNIGAALKVGGTVYRIANNPDSGYDPGGSFTTYSYSYSTNPKTGSAWTVADINGTGSNPLQQFGVASSDLNPGVQISMVYAQVTYTTDTLRLAISKDSGAWTDLGDFGSTTSCSYTLLPASGFLSSGIKIKFYLNGFSGGKYIELDNIVITDDTIPYHYDPQITFDINNAVPDDVQIINASAIYPDIIWFDDCQSARNGTVTFTNSSTVVTGSGTSFSGDVVAGNKIRLSGTTTWYAVQSVTDNTHLTLSSAYNGSTASGSYGVFDGYYYACKKDVTDLVKDYSNGADLSDPENPVYGNGNGTFTVGGVYSDTQSVQHLGKLADAGYGGWSLVTVYSSPETKGHQLYLFDRFRSVPNQDNGGPMVISESIGGFIVPDQISGETLSDDVARLTIFAGEGDVGLTGDYVAFVPQGSSTENKLWDGITCTSNSSSTPNNVWNSQFIDQSTMQPSTVAGIDVDTFHISWGSGWLKTGDTSATINMSTNGDGWVLLYMILSFRSQTTTGGSITYLITQ